MIADGHDAELDELRSIDRDCGAFLADLERRERERSGIATLKVEYNRVHGFYIEVTHAQAGKVPDDYRRRQTLKNAERYVTPELKTFEEKALSAQERALAREKLLFDELVARLGGAVPVLQRAAAALAALDVLAGLADRAEALSLVRPAFTAENRIEIRGGRHPVVERQVEHFIPNDVVLAPDRRLLIVTGPNMGGKSTYMRQTAVIALLACCGSFVPAVSATLGPIDAIYTRIGAADDLAGGRSTNGCRPPRISIRASCVNAGLVNPRTSARSASEARTSSEASALPADCSAGTAGTSADTSFSNPTSSRASARSCADRALSSNAFNSGVT